MCISLRVLCPRMSACAPVCACVQYWSAGLRPVCTCPCVDVCVCVPGEPVAGQRISPDQGYVRGGDADDRQPLRFCLPPLLLSSTHLQRLQGPPTRGTTLNTHKHTNVQYTHTHVTLVRLFAVDPWLCTLLWVVAYIHQLYQHFTHINHTNYFNNVNKI